MEEFIDRDFKRVKAYLSRINVLSTKGTPKSITILGAGISGLVAGYELKKLNYKVKIIEGNNRIGGRIWTYRFGSENEIEYGELGAMRIPFNHEFVHYYIHEMGLQHKLKKFTTIFENENCFIDFKGKIYQLKNVISDDFECKLFQNINLNSKYTKRLAILAKMIIDTVSPKEIGDLFEADLNNHLLTEIDHLICSNAIEISEENFSFNKVLTLFSKISNKCHSAVKMFMEEIIIESNNNLYQISGGMDQLPYALGNYLKDEIRLNAEVTGISLEKNKIKITINEIEKIYSDIVICTIPFTVLRSITLEGFSNEKLDAIHNLTYANATKVLFYCKERFWEKEKYGIKEGASISDGLFRQMYYPLSLNCNSSFNKKKAGVLLSSYVIGEDSDSISEINTNELVNLIKKNIGRFHPEIEEKDMIQDFTVISWGKYKWTRGGCCAMWSGEIKYNANTHEIVREKNKRLEQLFEAAIMPENRIYFAGEHCSKYQAWIEGSIISTLEQVEKIVQLK